MLATKYNPAEVEDKTVIPLAMAATLLTGLAGCTGTGTQLIDKPEFKSANRTFDIEALEALGRSARAASSTAGVRWQKRSSRIISARSILRSCAAR